MLMMLASGELLGLHHACFFEEGWAADAHDADVSRSSGKKAGQLMLMMLASCVLLGRRLGN